MKILTTNLTVILGCGILLSLSSLIVAEELLISENRLAKELTQDKELKQRKASKQYTQSILETKLNADYSRGGADTCLLCHGEDSAFPVLELFKTAHGNQGAQKGPFSENSHQCETCHGPAGKHAKVRLEKNELREPMITFKNNNGIPVAKKNEICLSCHQRKELNHWQGSVHQLADVSCTSCHQIHSSKDPMRVKNVQVQTCGECHTVQKLALNRASTHPLREGLMGCSDCHKPHDSDGEKLLVGDTTNETCFQCHTEKRGPFLWEHEPASDNCSNCHAPHGSNLQGMLTQRAPHLCQSCHSSQGHPSLTFGSESLASGNASAFLLGRSCVNCHSQVHGSNHPSGSRLQQ